ncbi:unnamed protein product [Sympodiomycopsis kandeliae]
MVKSLSTLLLLTLALLSLSVYGADPIAVPTPTASPGGGSMSSSSSEINIPSSAAAGGITITQPVQSADASYYKIASGVDVTFGWNFTSVLSYPNSLTLQAYCTSNKNTYPITVLPGTATQAVWNPYNYSVTAQQSNQPALIAETYRLQIFDERGLNVGASPGVMQPNQKVQFALYVPQNYTPLSAGWICGSCKNAGVSLQASPLAISLLAVVLTTLMSAMHIFNRR